MHAGLFTVRKSGYLAVLALLAATGCTGTAAYAQMQIPNPLIRPRGLTNPATSEVPPLPGAASAPQRNPVPASYPAAAGATDDPLQRELNEQKERLSGFYVSAIVGKQAVLRRSAAQRISTGTTPAPAVGSSMAPVPIGNQAPAMSTRNDALMLTDGESFDATGNVGSLYARVSNRQVVIYHVDDAAGPKPGKRHPIVFVGELETSGNPAQPPIVLERPDPLYKRSITVEIKARSASAPATDTQNQNQNQQAPGASPVPLQ